ncbi:MAG TPA: RNA polymerase sigma-70 factor [Pedobacter sp.]|nr:RNA polymerase sigma-70 factor [Pedobacter sp.]
MPDQLISLNADSELLDRLKDNDRIAFNVIYNKYWSKLYLSAYNLLRNKQISEDIIQELFVALWLKRSTAKIDNLNNYLFTAVRFQVFKAIRDGKGRTGLFEEIAHLSMHCEIESKLFEKEVTKRLDENIALLPEKCREIFILSRKKHLTVKEIAEQLQISPKTIENQIGIALRRLRSNMGDLLFWAAILQITQLN